MSAYSGCEMIHRKVSPNLPWTIGRALRTMELSKVFLIVDKTANERFRSWIEGLEDVQGSLGHFERKSWSTQIHKRHFSRQTRAFTLLLLAQKREHPLFGRLGRELLELIFSQFTQPVYVKHVSYEPQTADWDHEVENDKEEWLSALFEYWNKMVEEEGWSGRELSEMKVSVCGDPEEDSVCCCSDSCEMCVGFKSSAEQYGIYEI